MMKQPLNAGRTFERDEIAAYVDASAALVGLALADEHREGVISNLRVILNQAADLMTLDLGWEDEAAPVFEP
ncbi:MAG: DUF4089 domain-containing protein [Novosphingobium sp.]